MRKSKVKVKNQKFLLIGEKETLKLAESFAGRLRGGEVIGLIGELGAGKTVFVKGLARGLGVKRGIRSPTFLLMKIYKVRKSRSQKVRKIKFLCHVDAYRLTGADELIGIGLLEWTGRKETVTAIEWADKVPELLSGRKIITVNFEFGEKNNERFIEITK